MPKILVADDSTTIRRVVEHALGGVGVRVMSVADGDAAVDLARREAPDVVLCDVVMPGLSGYEVAEVFARDPVLARIPILLLTGAFEPFDAQRAQSCGAVGWIGKPFESAELRRRVEDALAGRAAQPVVAADELQAAGALAAAADEPPAEDLLAPFNTPPPEVVDAGLSEAPPVFDLTPHPVPLPGDEGFDLTRPPASPLSAGAVPAEMLREECRRQIALIAPEIVREVAWEVVPDLLERLLRETTPPPPRSAAGAALDDPESGS